HSGERDADRASVTVCRHRRGRLRAEGPGPTPRSYSLSSCSSPDSPGDLMVKHNDQRNRLAPDAVWYLLVCYSSMKGASLVNHGSASPPGDLSSFIYSRS